MRMMNGQKVTSVMPQTICMMHWFYPPQPGGVEVAMQNTCRELVRRGHSVFVLTSSQLEYTIEEDRGVQVHRIPQLRTDLAISRETCLDFYNFLTSFIKKYNIDLLHLHNFHLSQGIHHAITSDLAAKRSGIPSLIHLHGSIIAPLEKFIVRNVEWTKILSVSKWIENQVISDMIRDKAIVIYNGVDEGRFRPDLRGDSIREMLNISSEKVIYCPSRIIKTIEGILEDRKGVLTLLEAAKILKKDFGDFKLLLTGLGKSGLFKEKTNKLHRMLERKAQNFGILDNFILHSFTDDEMPLAYAAADIICLPSWNEPCSMVILEGMMSGKPVIAGESGGTPELIRDGDTGYLVEVKRPDILAEVLRDVLTDKKEARRVGENARLEAEKRFSLKVVVDKLEKIYGDVC